MSIGKKVIPCGVCHMGLHAIDGDKPAKPGKQTYHLKLNPKAEKWKLKYQDYPLQKKH
ncbi:hypothetical protein QF044_001626 [Chryseobacterium sp. W4I1]|nr:hypothetical protein [Chryseobacterium sp. W4I1]